MSTDLNGVAIIGMAASLPGAPDLDRFWKNLLEGRDSITRWESQEQATDFVRARSILPDADHFDAAFFNISPREAELIDPQQRLFLECCWRAFEDAGYDPFACSNTGVFGGASFNTYFVSQQCSQAGFAQKYAQGYQVENYPVLLGTNADFLATRVSYKLNLQGPSFTLASGCSTSLLAIWQACQSLLNYHCDYALAGGVSVTFPQNRGYRYQEGGMVSPDGHCRPFDSESKGTVFGDGVAVVALKRVEEAIAAGDHIYAVIRGSGINNDGARKVGFTAPAVDGQARAVSLALADAGVPARSIGYIETHGTATPLGDPIEIAALTKAFRASTDDTAFCALGTAKANIGHLDVAAGAVGLIKTALSLHHKSLPALVHFKSPNQNLNLSESPFYVNRYSTTWESNGSPRRAGVSAFGVGGTNVHLILEEAPARGAAEPEATEPAYMLPVSAKSAAALKNACQQAADYLEVHPKVAMSDVAFTLLKGRHYFAHRRAVVCRSRTEAICALRSEGGRAPKMSGVAPETPLPVAFLFPGQGSAYQGMGKGLYRHEPVFRKTADQCLALLPPNLQPLLSNLFTSGTADRNLLTDTLTGQPALFIVEYSLAKLWIEKGFQPEALLGHSLGEYVAACVAQVFSLESALMLVAKRARLMAEAPSGAMLAVSVPASEAAALLSGELSLAAVNSPARAVISGPAEQIDRLAHKLEQGRIPARRLSVSCAAHSSLMDAAAERFREAFHTVSLSEPRIPVVSCFSGDWLTPDQARNPDYWARQMRDCVQFQPAAGCLLSRPSLALVEAGPGETLATFVRQHPLFVPGRPVVSSLPVPQAESEEPQEQLNVLKALGSLWAHGAAAPQIQTAAGRRVPLPTYPFERKKFWLEAPQAQSPELPPKDKNLPMPRVSPPSVERSARLEASLSAILEELSGLPSAQLDPSSSFLELGFDSLFLTQVSLAVQKRYSQKIGFRQLLDAESSIQALARYLDARLPPEQLAAPSAPIATHAPADTTPVAAFPADGSLNSLLKQQLDTMSALMAKQLDAIRNQMPAGALPPEPVPATAPAPAPEFPAFGPYKPTRKTSVKSLSDQQNGHLQRLIDRYTARTASSKRLTAQNRQTLADPRVVSGFRSQWKEMVYPLVTDRSQGSRLWDIDGNEYVDILNGFGPIMLGHAPSFVVEAVERQLRAGFEIGPQSPIAGAVARLICEMIGMERATFCNTGSEAVMAALRVSRTVTGRDCVALFAGSYHGQFDEVLVKRAGNSRSGPIAPGIPSESVSNVTVLEYGAPESLQWIETHAQDLAAVLVEPVQSRHPALQPVEFLKQIRRITEQSGTALIFDEVVTGFRVHSGGVQALFGIRADLATYGKVLAGGLPIGVLAGSSKFMDALDGGPWSYGDASSPETGMTFFAGTFVRHPLALAAAHAVLLHLRESGPVLQQDLAQKTGYLVEQINSFFQLRQAPFHLESFSSIFYFSVPADEPLGSLFYYHLRLKGVHVLEGFPCFLTTAHSQADLEKIIRAFQETVVEMQEDGMLSGTAPVPHLPPATPEQQEAPLTQSQIEILVADHAGPEASCAFNESFTLRLEGILAEHALRGALAQLMERHEALRAVLHLEQGRQTFRPASGIDLPLVDLSAMDFEAQAAGVGSLTAEDAATPFDMAAGQLVRVVLIRLAPNQHLLRFTAHHAVCDGWSVNVLLEELAELYSARALNRSVSLSPPASFAQFAKEEAAGSSESEAYWLKKFAELPPLLQLPLDRPRPELKRYQGATCRVRVGKEEAAALGRSAAQANCTLYGALFAAFATLLNRLSGQDDLVIGVPSAGQAQLDQNNLVGHCVNFLPIRMQLSENASVTDALAASKAAILEAYDHQNYTYGTLVRKLNVPRDPARLPLVEVQFNLERLGAKLSFQNLSADVDPSPKSFVNFDLFLNIVEGEDGLVLDCDYNTGLFDETTVLRWLGYYSRIVAEFAEAPHAPIARLDLLTPSERLLLTEGSGSGYTKQGHSLPELIRQQADRKPAEPAVVFGKDSLTYRELQQRSLALATRLRSLGIGRGAAVAVMLGRSLEIPVALLGVLQSGAAYVPLDPEHPKERRANILKDVQPAAVVTLRLLANQFEARGVPVLAIDDPLTLGASEAASLPDSPSENDLAYVIYTSGSTGEPKGVEVTHRALVNLLRAVQSRPGFTDRDTLLAVTTLAFDIAGLEIFLPLVSGGKLVIAGKDTLADGHQLLQQMEDCGATVVQATPAMWRFLLDAGLERTSHLKILCGGEALPRDLANRLLQTGAAVWNMYGPTETTIWSSAERVTASDGFVPIGQPLANTRFYVLDRFQAISPTGVPGELYIAGDGVAAGYRNRPSLNKSSFFPDPYFRAEPSRMYRTGDLIRRHSDGRFEFLGRLDHQIKLRGFRIEPGEVEAALLSHPAIQNALVLLREDKPGEQRLVAYYVAAGASSVEPNELCRFVSALLPYYMTPSAFVSLPALPQTPNGKIDRPALPKPHTNAVPALEQNGTAVDFVAPRTPREQTMADIWSDVLQVKAVSVHDNLFRLGADSLQIFQISARAQRAQLPVTPALLLQHRTISALSAVLNATEVESGITSTIRSQSRDNYRIRKSTL